MNWPIKKLGDVLQISRGGSPRPIENYITEDENGLNWIKIGDVQVGAKYITHTKEKIRKEGLAKTREVKAGDFLLSNSMSFGRPYITKINGCIHDGWLTLRDKEKIFNTDFLYHVLNSNAVKEQFMKYASGAVVKNLNIDAVSKVVVAIPPLAEQQRIAEVLDTADRILKLRESAFAKLDSLIYSLFNQYFLIGNQWDSVKLIDVANTTSGGTPKRDMQNYYGGDICWVKSGELNSDLITETEEHLTKDGMKNSSAKLMPEGTVLLAMYGATIGAVSMLGVPATTNQAICCINVNSKLLVSEYLMYFLKFNKNKIINMAVGGAQPNINQNIVRNIEIPIPSMQKQLDFLKILNFIKIKKDLLKKSSRSLTSLNLSLQHQSFAVN